MRTWKFAMVLVVLAWLGGCASPQITATVSFEKPIEDGTARVTINLTK